MNAPLLLESSIEEILKLMGFACRATVREVGPTLSAEAEVSDGSGTIIGRGGDGIDALEYILRLTIRKKIPESPHVILDINGYRAERASALRERANVAADHVRKSGESYAFEPMHPRERRVIHTELARRADIITESSGEGDLRHIVIRPA